VGCFVDVLYSKRSSAEAVEEQIQLIGSVLAANPLFSLRRSFKSLVTQSLLVGIVISS